MKIIRFVLVMLMAYTFANAAEPQSFLWKIEKGGKTSYLVGTLHIGTNENLNKALEKALLDSDCLITETDLISVDDVEIMHLSMQMMDITGSLPDKLGAGYMKKVAGITGHPEEVLANFKPWVVFTAMMYNIPQGYSELYGLDMLLSMKAEELGKRRVGLEGSMETMSYIMNIPEAKLIPMIRYGADHSAKLAAETKSLAEYYYSNQVDKVLADFDAAISDKSQYPAGDGDFWINWYKNELLAKRNKNWLPIIEEQIAKETTLIAVGAAHLYYDSGLLKELERRGYKLSAIR